MVGELKPPTKETSRRRIAVTVDDLPAFGSLPDGITRSDICRQLLHTFQQYGVAGACGFVNGGLLENEPEGLSVLLEWFEAGHDLGNHTYSHINLSRIGAEGFIADVQLNAEVLEALQLPPSPRW